MFVCVYTAFVPTTYMCLEIDLRDWVFLVFRFQAGRRKYCVQFGTMVQVCHALFLQYNKNKIKIMQCSDLYPNWPVIQADLQADYIVSHLHLFQMLVLVHCAVLP